MTTVGEIDFGASDAESDERLGEYFIETDYVRQALEGRKTIFLGRKGAGKTALFTQLPELYRAQGLAELLTIPMSPDQYAWGALKEYKEQGILAEQAHTNAWKLTLAITIASEIVNVESRWSAEAGDAIKTLRQFLSENYSGETVDLKNAATKLLTGLKSFNLSAFGFGVGYAEKDTEARLLTPQVIERLLELIDACTREHGVIVLLDRLDDSWDGTDESKTLLIGLLKAAKDLNTRIRFDGDKGLQIIAFLRSDIYPLLRFDDKDKHRSLEYSIVWTQDELAEMITKRLPGDVTVHDVLVALGPLLVATQRAGLRRLSQMHPRTHPAQLLNHKAPARRCLQRNLELLAGEPSKEAAHPLSVRRRDTRPADLPGHAVKPLPRDLRSVLIKSHYDRHRGLLKLHGLNAYADYPRLS